MAKHTPGPWYFFDSEFAVGVTSKNSDVAWTRYDSLTLRDTRRAREEDIANAKAMAAVPAMIDALAMIMKHALQAQTQPEFAKDQAQEIEMLALGALKKAGVA